MVEFGLALPILLLIVYGLIETGRLVFIYASVVSAARQAVRYGSATGDNTSGTPYYNDCTGIRTAAQRLGFLQRINSNDIDIFYDEGPGTSPAWGVDCPITEAGHPENGDRINVAVSAPYSPILPFFPFNSTSISSSATRTLLVGVSIKVDPAAIVLPPGATGSLAVLKTASPTSFDHVGQVISYYYQVTNLGTDSITDIVVLDDNIDWPPGGAASCPGTTLAGGASFTCTATHTVTQTDINNGTLSNTGTVLGLSNGITVTASDSMDMNFVPRPEITLSKTGVSPLIAERGQVVTYTLTLQNSGNVPLTDPYTISDAVLDNWTCPTGSPVGTNILAIGSSVTCTGTHVLTNNDISRTYIDNSATATAKYGAFTVTSNVASTRVLVPEMLLTITASPTSVTALGTQITYTYTVTNRKGSSVNNVKITDSRGANGYACVTGLTAAGQAGSTGSCTRTYSGYTQADMDSGSIVNTGSASATGGVSSNVATATVTVTQLKTLTLTKTANLTEAYVLGTSITYTYKLTNSGNVTLSAPYKVTDDRIPNIDCTNATGTMAPLTSKTCVLKTYQVTQADIDAGSIVNHATASAMFGTLEVKGTGSWTVKTFAGARLGLKKSADPAYFTSTGQLINYKFTLVNTGGVDLAGPYSVTDSKMASASITCPPSTTPIPIGGSIDCTASYIVSSSDNLIGSITNTASATAVGNSGTVTSPSVSLTVNKFQCTTSRLTHSDPTPLPSGADLLWTVTNNTGLAIHISSITVSWGAAPPSLTQVILGGTTIWNTTTASNGGFIVPGGPWLLNLGSTVIQIKFTTPAANPRIVLTFSESGCPVLDSNIKYGT